MSAFQEAAQFDTMSRIVGPQETGTEESVWKLYDGPLKGILHAMSPGRADTRWTVPGKPAEGNHGLLSINSGLLSGIVRGTLGSFALQIPPY